MNSDEQCIWNLRMEDFSLFTSMPRLLGRACLYSRGTCWSHWFSPLSGYKEWSSQFFTLHRGERTKSCLISFSSALLFSWVSSCKVSLSVWEFTANPGSKVHPTVSSCFNMLFQDPPGFSTSPWGLLCLNPFDTGRGATSQTLAVLTLLMKCQVSTFTMPG